MILINLKKTVCETEKVWETSLYCFQKKVDYKLYNRVIFCAVWVSNEWELVCEAIYYPNINLK